MSKMTQKELLEHKLSKDNIKTIIADVTKDNDTIKEEDT